MGSIVVDEDFPRITSLLEKYADLPADFADVSPVALCEQHKICDVVSVDIESW